MSPSTKQRKRKLKVTTDFHAKPFYGSLWQSLDAHHNKAHFETKSPGVPSSPRKKCKNELECDKFFYYHCLLPTKKKRENRFGVQKKEAFLVRREKAIEVLFVWKWWQKKERITYAPLHSHDLLLGWVRFGLSLYP